MSKAACCSPGLVGGGLLPPLHTGVPRCVSVSAPVLTKSPVIVLRAHPTDFMLPLTSVKILPPMQSYSQALGLGIFGVGWGGGWGQGDS